MPLTRVQDFVLNAVSRPVPGASVAVLTQPANTTTQPGSPLAQIFQDAAGTIPAANPLTTDGLGNYSFYISPGTYTLQIYGNGIYSSTTPEQIVTTDFVVPFAALKNVRYADQFSGADLGAQINAAAADVGSNGIIYAAGGGTISTALVLPAFTELHFGPGNYTFTGSAVTNNISNGAVKIRGAGAACTALFVNSATSNLFTVAASYFELSGVRIKPSTGIARTAGSAISVTTSAGSLGYVRDVELRDMFRGFTFDGAGVSAWTLENIKAFSDGGNWDYLIRTHGVAPTSTCTSFIFRNIMGNWSAAGSRSTALFVFDSLTDSVDLVGVNFIVGGTVPGILCQDSDNAGAGQWPRWIHCLDVFIESANTTLINLLSVRDFAYECSYVSGCNVGVAIGAGANGVKFIGNIFPNINQQAITVAAGSQFVVIQGNNFETTGTNGNAIYPIIDVAANTNDFIIEGNTNHSFALSNAWPNYGVNIASGTSTRYTVANNDFQQVANGAVNNGGTGTSQWVYNNTPSNDKITSNLTLSGSLAVQGPLSATGASTFADGTASAPGIAYAAESGTGLYRSAASELSVSLAGIQRFVFDPSAFSILGGSPALVFSTDTKLTRTVAQQLQLGGSNVATPSAQTFSTVGSRGGTDTNVAGGNLTIVSGLGTGSSTLSKVILAGPALGTSGTTQQTQVQRTVVGYTKTGIANNSATTFLTVPIVSGGWGAVQVAYTIEVSDGTNFQIESGYVTAVAVNKAGTLTVATPVKSSNTQAVSTGTLAVTFGTTTGTNLFNLQITSNSSLTPTTHRLFAEITNLNFVNDITLA